MFYSGLNHGEEDEISSCDTPIIPEEKQVDQRSALNNRILGNVRAGIFNNVTHLPENRKTSYSSVFFKVDAHRQIPKAENHASSEEIDVRVLSSDSSTPWNSDNCRSESSMSFSGWSHRNNSGDINRFEVKEIVKRKEQQVRTLIFSEEGIINISPHDKERWLERWSDVLLCYKIDRLTVAIKYRKGERWFKTLSWKLAQNLYDAVSTGMNEYQEHSRTQPNKSIIDGFDQKENEKADLELKEECKEENFVEIRRFVEQILLFPKSKVFKLKKNICNFALPNVRRVKELRKYLDQFKHKIFEEYRMEFWAKIDLTDPGVRKRTLSVIESVIESTCMPHHIDEVDKVLRAKYKSPKNLIQGLNLLYQKPQEFFGIDKRLRSKGEWLNAVLELEKLPKKMLPSAKVKCLLSTTRYIHQEAKQHHKEQITGDDLLPIVIYVMVKASWKSRKLIFTEADQKFIEILISPEALQGECGYYLCVFSAGSEFIRNYDSQRKVQKINKHETLRKLGSILP